MNYFKFTEKFRGKFNECFYSHQDLANIKCSDCFSENKTMQIQEELPL